MAQLSGETLRATADKLIKAHQEASRSNDWLFFVDELYAQDCVYTCEYAGVMTVVADGIDEIKATHYGRDMQVGWEANQTIAVTGDHSVKWVDGDLND